ncbi:hypothetical protein LEP1GSC016_3368 [Leptospira borgpetersenii serovar Hardjo-bovis str. Sponselee]|uniref:Uncharacterized protein n=1 Tax=Leptospira borgpetersenii serovar Hardjo-bovis str. Sponselee TaxID=1303729 RepID=M6BBY9_LEPBO|nr:hypothetical protein LEP1GSC016_3368 [Leptospira borgpetersenii serovar Hardjo-bovis str. Sponselee]
MIRSNQNTGEKIGASLVFFFFIHFTLKAFLFKIHSLQKSASNMPFFSISKNERSVFSI